MTPRFPEQTPDELLAELVMLRAADPRTSLMVLEGVDDQRFWLSFIDKSRCMLIPAHGKRNVVACIQRVDVEKLAGVVGVVDTDFDALDGAPTIDSPNIIRTADHDLEALLFQSGALDRLLHEQADLQKLRAFELAAGHDIRTALITRALPFARLRWLSRRQKYRFEQFAPNLRFVCKTTWVILEDTLHVEAAKLAGVELAALRELLGALPTASSWALCQGHDILEILRLGLQSTLGDTRQRSTRELAGLLRQSFSHSEFLASTLHRDLRTWEARNAPYRVLP